MQHFTNYKQGLSINQNAQIKKLDNHRFLQDYFIGGHFPTRYRKIPNVSPKYKSPGACTWIIALKYKVKLQSKITFNYKASPIDFETQISLRREAPPNISPSKNKPLKKGL